MELYSSHVRELLARLPCSHSELERMTRAEVLLAFHEASLVAPLNRRGFAAYSALMREHFPDFDQGAEPAPEQWAGQIEEDIAGAQRKRITRLKTEKS